MSLPYTPLSAVLPRSLVPEGIFDGGALGFLDDLACLIYDDRGVAEDPLGEADEGFEVFVRCKVMAEARIGLPFLQGASIVLGKGDSEDTGLVDVQLSVRLHPDDPPDVTFRLRTTVLSLSFGPELLRPVTVTRPDGHVVVTPIEGNVGIPLPFDLLLRYQNEEWSFDFDVPAGDSTSLSVPPAMIGNTGVAFEAAGISLNFAGTGSRPVGAPAGWKGLYLDQVTIYVPSLFDGQIGANGLGIGAGGFYGELNADFALSFDAATGTFAGPLATSVLGLQGGIRSVRLAFVQNVPTAFDIGAGVVLPYFDQPIDVVVGFDAAGGLTASLSAPGGVAQLSIPDLLDLVIAGLRFELVEGLVTVSIQGSITPTVAGLAWPTFQISELSIDSKGHVKLDGGWLDLTSPISFELYGFRAEVSRIGFGTEEDGTRWIGFSAGIQFVQSFALGGSVEGLKIKWKEDDISLEVRGVGVQLLIPETLRLDGKIAFIDEGTVQGFKGGVKLQIIPINLTIDAQLLIGRNSQSPAYSFAYIFVAAELPVGIPLLNTGLSFFGFAGLVGYNVAPAKGADDPWFDGWYLKPPVGVSGVDKWRDERDAFALGVGTTIGTGSDNGYTFNGRFLLVLVLPGPLILLDGIASFLQARGSGEPNFLSLAVFDGRARTLLFNVQAHYAYTETGDLIDITGFAEVFFDFANAKNFHIYLGMDAPESKRIRANIIELFEANSYFMLDHTSARMGAWFGLDRKWKYGPLRVTLEAWIEGAAVVSWAPKQFEGSLTLHGDVGLKAFGIGASLNLFSLLEVRAPHPYRVHAEFSVKMNLPWPLPDPKAKVKLTWEEEIPPPTPRPLEVLGLEHLKVSEKWLMASSLENAPVVPLDARPVLSFQRRMTDHTGLATNALPSASERVGGFRFRYRLDEVRLEKRASSGEAWVDATTPSAPSLPAGNIWTQWLAVPATSSDPSPQSVPPMTKLMMWSRTPFDYGRETGGTATQDGFLDENPAWPCGYDWTPIAECADFEDRSLGPMPPFSALDRMVIATREAQIIKWGDDWIDVDRAAVIDGKTTVKTYEKHSRDPRQSALRIVFPPHAAVALLYVGRGTKGVLAQPGREPREIAYVEKPIEVDAEPGNLTYIDLMGTVLLLRVCWVARDEWDRVQDGERSTAAVGSEAIDAMTATAELLQPHRQYRMTVQTVVERSANGGDSWQDVGSFTDTGYFQTQSAPGLAAATSGNELEPSKDSEHYPARGPLKDLSPYVHRTVPGNGARPVYRAYDVGVEFNESYVEAMYILDGTPLVLQLHDSNGEPVSDPSGEPLNLMGQWRPIEPEQLSEVERPEEAAWIGRLAAGGCADVAGVRPPDPQGMWAAHPRLLLAPDTIYRAVLGPLTPVAIVPLAPDGMIARTAAGLPIVIELAGSASDQLNQMYSSGDANKLLIGPNVIIETSLGAQEGVVAFDAGHLGELAMLDGIALELITPAQTLVRVYDWTFTTSRFATFVHHLQSFRDDVHSLHDELGQPAGDLLTAEQLTWLEALVAARPLGVPAYADPEERQQRRDEEGQQFDRVFALVGMEGKALPKRVEVTVLDDANRSYALLIESPEPLAWERIQLTVRRRAAAFESLLTPMSPVKFIAAGFAPSDAAADLVQEFVDIILLESLDLAGTKIQVQDDVGTWQDYFAFPEDEVTPEGTVLRVHTGTAAADANPAPEINHYYAQDAGSAVERRFGSADTRVRLLDPAAQVLHERVFVRAGLTTRIFRILRSRDGTRALLFFRQAATAVSPVPSGTVRLSWTFRRNILPEEPILRRMGSDRDEITSVEVAVP
jgi:hypothetical protein